jgi:hypothetical protein
MNGRYVESKISADSENGEGGGKLAKKRKEKNKKKKNQKNGWHRTRFNSFF